MQGSTVRILPVRSEDIPDLVRLARDVWYRHYPGIITPEQIEYMLARGYSPEAIETQLAGGAVWWDKLLLDGQLVAFSSCERASSADDLKIDKLYVRYDLRGRGYGGLLIEHARRRALDLGCKQLVLQVNKNNTSAIEAYKKNGFAVVESLVFDIGGGFVMDDYVMARDVGCG